MGVCGKDFHSTHVNDGTLEPIAQTQTWVQIGSIICRIPYTIVIKGAVRSKTIHQHSVLVLVSGTSLRTLCQKGQIELPPK